MSKKICVSSENSKMSKAQLMRVKCLIVYKVFFILQLLILTNIYELFHFTDKDSDLFNLLQLQKLDTC